MSNSTAKTSVEAMMRSVAEEVTSSQFPVSRRRRTLKDLVDSIDTNVSSMERRQRSALAIDQDKKFAATVALGVMCFLVAWGLTTNPPDDGFFHDFLLEITALGLLSGALALLVSFEQIPLIQTLLTSNLVRVVFGLLFTLVIAISTSAANSALNAALGIDASNAPIARAMLTAILVIKSGWVVAVLIGFNVLVQLGWLIHDIIKHGWAGLADQISWSRVFLVLSSIILAWSYTSMMKGFANEERLPIKAYILAHRFDFNDKAVCIAPATAEASKYLFVGANQDVVLVGPRLSSAELGTWFFTEEETGLNLGDIKPVLKRCTPSQ